VIEVQLVGRFAQPAFSAIPLPHFEFDRGRDDSAALHINAGGLTEILVVIYRYELELEHLSMVITLLPSIYEMEYAVVRPNARMNFS
jgi:hypothetical protein